jgi:hypothetical protein
MAYGDALRPSMLKSGLDGEKAAKDFAAESDS